MRRKMLVSEITGRDVRHLMLILALAVFVSWGCATTSSTSTAHTDYGSNAAAQRIDPPSKQTIDANISSAIKMKFATDQLLSNSDIHVDTDQRNVILKGKLKTQAEADRAIQLGRSVDGVRSVHSNFSVKQTKITLP